MRRITLLAVDAALILFATLFAFALRENFEIEQERLLAFLPYLGATAASSIILVPAVGLNRSIWRFSSTNDYLRAAAVVIGVCVGAVALIFAYNRLENVARSLPVLQGIVGISVLIGARALHRWRHAARQQKRASASLHAAPAKAYELNVLIVGVNRMAETYIQALTEQGGARVNIAGLVGHTGRHVGRLVASHPVLGLPEEIESILDRLEVHGVTVDKLVVAVRFSALSESVQKALLHVERSRGISVHFLTEILGLDAVRRDNGFSRTADITPALQAPPRFEIGADELLAFSQRRFWLVKRGADLILALIILAVFSPFFLIGAILVASSVGFPVVFWQRRPGLGGRPFHLYKFRTMGAAHAPDGRRLSDAERVSRIGNFMRRTRLDELPQLFNIIRGDMSFVGPRPLLPKDQPRACEARLLVRPGLTGWAQVIGGREISPEDKAALDVWYVRNASMFLDIEVWVRTVPIVLFGERISWSWIDRAKAELGEPGVMKEELAY